MAAAERKICSSLQFVTEKPFKAFSYHSDFHSEGVFLINPWLSGKQKN